MTLHAVYGASMDPKVMTERCPQSPLSATGWLEGWRLTFGGEEYGWDGALATVVEDPAERVFVAVYDISPFDQENFDAWEGAQAGLYRPIRERIQTLQGEILAVLYTLDAYEGGLPSASYLGVLTAAAEAVGAPDDYIKALRLRPCN
jgi:hypothetical protein